MQDILSLLPHAKKDSKVESKQSKGNALNELLELRSCLSCLFFEVYLSYFFPPCTLHFFHHCDVVGC